MNSVNRQVAVIKPKEPYVDWINSLPGMSDDPCTIESLSNDCTALLLPHFDDDDQSLKFIKKIYGQIFEIELESWSTDEKFWPKKRDIKLFQKWFRIEFHSEVFDFGKGAIELEEYCAHNQAFQQTRRAMAFLRRLRSGRYLGSRVR